LQLVFLLNRSGRLEDARERVAPSSRAARLCHVRGSSTQRLSSIQLTKNSIKQCVKLFDWVLAIKASYRLDVACIDL
jgi:hypothetical protein